MKLEILNKVEQDVLSSDGANRCSVGETYLTRFEAQFDASRPEQPWERETAFVLVQLPADDNAWVKR